MSSGLSRLQKAELSKNKPGSKADKGIYDRLRVMNTNDAPNVYKAK